MQGDTERFERTLNLWGKKLLDLSKRNPMLNLKVEKKNIIEFLYPTFDELYERLVLKPRQLRFVNVYLEKNKEELALLSEQKRQVYERNLSLNHAKAIAKKTKKQGNGLITNQLDGKLSKLLYRLKSKENHFISERGINTLFLAFGILTWY